jgi:EpsI family protein
MIARAVTILVLVVAAGAYANTAAKAEAEFARVNLHQLPLTLDGWRGIDTEPFADDVLAQLGVDEYVSRRYARAGAAPVSIYVGYYHSQRQGDTIHSPQNCLPGAGWHPIESGRQTIGTGDTAAEVNRYVISKGLSQQVVLYWYQGRGRVIANEYANKAFLMLDAARLGRTSGGLVRLITPVVSTTDDATRELTAFASALLPHLNRHLP